MTLMSKDEQNKELIRILNYIDDVCRKNDIKYTLIGGSLIGAIRHKGMIPWDDDIDIILMKSEYEKLINILSNEKNEDFKLFFKNDGSYYYPFAKLVSTRTVLKEKYLKTIDGYGLFVDIFEYDNVPNNKLMQKLHYNKVKFNKTFINGYFYEKIPENSSLLFFRKIREFISNKLGIVKILNIYKKEINKFNKNKKCNYVMSSWPSYKMSAEIQKKVNFNEYIDVEFDGIKVMIIKNYDEVLKNTFGNYMELPPESKRVAHCLEVYWRE